MVNEPSPRRIKAGEAMMREIREDPELQAMLEAVVRHNKKKWQGIGDEMNENMESARALVELVLERRPKTIEDWESVAGIIKMPFENIRSGDLTLREIVDAVGHWATEIVARKRLEMLVERGGVYTPAAGNQQPEPDHTEPEAPVNVVRGYLGGQDLRDALGIHPERQQAFKRKLDRSRKQLPDGDWNEMANPLSNAPTYIYRVDSEAILRLAATYKVPKPA